MKEALAKSSESRPDYVPPTIRILNEDEVLAAFQMTAAKISAAGCWWGSCPNGS